MLIACARGPLSTVKEYGKVRSGVRIPSHSPHIQQRLHTRYTPSTPGSDTRPPRGADTALVPIRRSPATHETSLPWFCDRSPLPLQFCTYSAAADSSPPGRGTNGIASAPAGHGT